MIKFIMAIVFVLSARAIAAAPRAEQAQDCKKCRCSSYPVEKSCENCCVIGSAAEVLSQLLKPDQIPRALLNRSVCVLVFPAVRRVAVGIGASYGRGVITCRTGADMAGAWSSPAMYKLDTGSLGVQLGSSQTDYVLLVETKAGARKILSGDFRLGADATAVAGPTGSTAVAAIDSGVDVLTYSRARSGLFAGASLGSVSLASDNDANRTLYGKSLTATEIVRNGTAPSETNALTGLLDKVSPRRPIS
jgi:lipid-binding SYLF domain-containing protein